MAVLLFAFSVPTLHPDLAGDALVALSVLSGVWVVRLVWFLLARIVWGPGGRARAFVVMPVGALLIIGALLIDVPLRVRWELSKPAFERRVAELEPGDHQPRRGERIGLYEVASVKADEGPSVMFDIDSAGATRFTGFHYSPEGPPSPGTLPVHHFRTLHPEILDVSRWWRLEGLRPLGGGWYTYVVWT